jgi:hypothetical protein
MIKLSRLLFVIGCASVTPAYGQQAWTGTLSDTTCGASHHAVVSAGGLTDRQCIFQCIQALARYVLVDGNGRVIPIANQDAAGLPLYAGRPVRVTGELWEGAIVASKVEAIAAHLHLGHIMTNWRDTPGGVGLLIAASSDAKIAAAHAQLVEKSTGNPEELKLHAGHVLNALDPSLEPRGPSSGYGVKKGATGALQHLESAVQGEGATVNIKTHATHVSASLKNVLLWTDQAIAKAQEIRVSSAAVAAELAAELAVLVSKINDGIDSNQDGQIGWQSGEGGLQQARTHMTLMMKGEGLENAPR